MKIFLTSAISVIFIIIAGKQFLTSRRVVHPDEAKMKSAQYTAVSIIFHIICYMVSDIGLSAELPCSMMIGLIPISLMAMSLFATNRFLTSVVYGIAIIEVAAGLLLCFSIYFSEWIYLAVLLIACSIIAFTYIYSIYNRLKDVKSVMKTGSVWTNVTLSVDSIYLAIIQVTTMLYAALSVYKIGGGSICISVVTFIYALIYVALTIRILNSSAFVIMTEHERKIIESMKISNVDTMPESAGTVLMYKNLYERVLEYFVEEKPYLNPNLTINDIVEVVFSNKLYISKAISQYTGRNFCQFVNYYRVIHAVELYRNNTNLKVLELASRSGFNSVVSFGMAFRLYMGEKPGDWCRKEKYRLDKLKK